MPGKQGALLGKGGVEARVAVQIDAGFGAFVGDMPSQGPLGFSGAGDGHLACNHFGGGLGVATQRAVPNQFNGVTGPLGSPEIA